MDLLLEITPVQQDSAWQQSKVFAHPSTCLSAYINRLALLTVLPWLEQLWQAKATTQSYWELVNGTAITINQTRLVLIPSDAIDTLEIRVPQEWVDIPSWAADYYLAVQVNTEDGWIKVWGYTTHKELKQLGNYNKSECTYSLDNEDLIHNLSVLWVTRQLCPDEPTKTEVRPLPILTAEQANALIKQLSK